MFRDAIIALAPASMYLLVQKLWIIYIHVQIRNSESNKLNTVSDKTGYKWEIMDK